MIRPLVLGLLALFLTSGVWARANAVARPSVVENGSDVVLFNYAGGTSPIAFTPDGNAYLEYRNVILKIAPDGTTTQLPVNDRIVSRSGQTIVYSNGYLWYEVYHGIVRIRPDGSQHRYFQFTQDRVNGFHYPSYLTPGADGLYFNFVTHGYSEPYAYHIGRIDLKGTVTIFSLPPTNNFMYDLPMAWANGHLYFEYLGPFNNSAAGSLGRLESDGTLTLLPGSSHCIGGEALVFARNALYSVGEAYDTSHNELGEALCRTTLRGNFTTLTTPSKTASSYGYLGIDAQDDIWTTDLFGAGLYSYNIPTASISGPYEPSKLATAGPYVYVGTDQNVWTFTTGPFRSSFIAVYVRHVLMFEPTTVDLSSSAPSANFITVESLLRGPWTAKSLDSGIATVSPATSQSGRFTVTETGSGKTSIGVTDLYGNVLYEPVTAH